MHSRAGIQSNRSEYFRQLSAMVLHTLHRMLLSDCSLHSRVLIALFCIHTKRSQQFIPASPLQFTEERVRDGCRCFSRWGRQLRGTRTKSVRFLDVRRTIACTCLALFFFSLFFSCLSSCPCSRWRTRRDVAARAMAPAINGEARRRSNRPHKL